MEVSEFCHSSKKFDRSESEELEDGLGGRMDHGYWVEDHVFMNVVSWLSFRMWLEIAAVDCSDIISRNNGW